MNTLMVDKPLTLKQFADNCNCSAMTIRRYLKAGKITGYKLNGKDWRIYESEVMKVIQLPPVNISPRILQSVDVDSNFT